MRNYLFKSFLLPMLLGIFSVFSGSVWADQGYVWRFVQEALPTPHIIIRPDASTPLPVIIPPLFRSGHGLFMSANQSFNKITFVAHDSDDPLGR